MKHGNNRRGPFVEHFPKNRPVPEKLNGDTNTSRVWEQRYLVLGRHRTDGRLIRQHAF